MLRNKKAPYHTWIFDIKYRDDWKSIAEIRKWWFEKSKLSIKEIRCGK